MDRKETKMDSILAIVIFIVIFFINDFCLSYITLNWKVGKAYFKKNAFAIITICINLFSILILPLKVSFLFICLIPILIVTVALNVKAKKQ